MSKPNTISESINQIKEGLKKMKASFAKSSVVTINGQSFSGSNISMINGKLMIDGKPQDTKELEHVINIEIHGDVKDIQNENGSITARDVGSVNTSNGKVICGNVTGNVTTSNGKVNCGDVGGSVHTSNGSIHHGIKDTESC